MIEPAITAGVAYKDVGRAIKWLTEILGLNVARSWGPDDSPVYAYLSWRSEVLSVFLRPTDNEWADTGPASTGLLADEETITRAYERAVSAGAEVIKPLASQQNPAVPEGYLGFSVRDPEGNIWSTHSRGPQFEVGDDGEIK